jgi:hypothetical protein
MKYTILARKPKPRDEGAEIILADTGPDEYQRWVTWVMDTEGHCFWGHYYEELPDATRDYEART